MGSGTGRKKSLAYLLFFRKKNWCYLSAPEHPTSRRLTRPLVILKNARIQNATRLYGSAGAPIARRVSRPAAARRSPLDPRFRGDDKAAP